MKIAFVTGSAKGLGKEIALALAGLGYVPIIHYNKSREEAQKVVSEIAKSGIKTKAYQADLLAEKEVGRLLKEVTADFGRVDILINNVGNFLYKEFTKTTNQEFRDMIETNIYSTLYVSRAVLPLMRKQKSGQIINIGAVGCERLVIRKNSTPYFLGKTGVYVLTKVLAATEAENGIRVNMISPASLEADIFEPSDFPAGRPVKPGDIAQALLFLLSPENSYINGANIEVAGGFIPGFK